jgi:hypothetical protein
MGQINAAFKAYYLRRNTVLSKTDGEEAPNLEEFWKGYKHLSSD